LIENKADQLEEIAKEISVCQICRQNAIGNHVPGEGNPDAKVVFIGEAPGRVESQTGRPFIGRSGQLLRTLIRNAGLKEGDVYITSPVKYLPSYKTPKPKDIVHGRMHLTAQLKVIQPKLLVLLGNTAVKAMLPGKKLFILKDHGKIIRYTGYKCLVTIHPAAVIRFPKYRAILEADFLKVKSYIQNST